MEKKEFLTIGIILLCLAIVGILLPWTNKTEFISNKMQEFSTLMWFGHIICIIASISYIFAIIWNKDSFLELNCEIVLGGFIFLMIVGLLGFLIAYDESSKLSNASSYFHYLYMFEMPNGNQLLEILYYSIYKSFSQLELKYLYSNVWISIHNLPIYFGFILGAFLYRRIRKSLKEQRNN